MGVINVHKQDISKSKSPVVVKAEGSFEPPPPSDIEKIVEDVSKNAVDLFNSLSVTEDSTIDEEDIVHED